MPATSPPLQHPCSTCSCSIAWSWFACVAHCFQNEMTLPHGENKLPLLYRQISLKVFKEDSQAVNFVDDIGGEI